MCEMKKNTFLIIALISSLNSFSQAPGIQWQNTIGGSGLDGIWSIQQSTDGGYILAGNSFSDISGDKTENSNGSADNWIVKLDSLGIIEWQNSIGGTDIDYISSIQQTGDGGYILGSYSSSPISGDKSESNWDTVCIPFCLKDYWLIKIDSIGIVQWENTIGGNKSDELFSVQQTTDGGYILGGSSGSDSTGDKSENNWDSTLLSNDYWIIKTDSLGNIQWQNTIGGDELDWLFCTKQTTDGGYILAGRSRSLITGDKTVASMGYDDFWIVKTDAFGNIDWQKAIGGSEAEDIRSIQLTDDGGYILGGSSRSNISGDKTENNRDTSLATYDYWVVKIDFDGNVQWEKTIGGSRDDQLYSLQKTTDGGYILGGFSYSNISGDKTENNCDTLYHTTDYWIVKINSLGNILWDKSFGGIDFDNLTCMQQTADDGYILGGYSASGISGDKTENSNGLSDFWIIKLYPDTIMTSTNNPVQHAANSIQIFPNPTTRELRIQLMVSSGSKCKMEKVEIADVFGNSIYYSDFNRYKYPNELAALSIDVSSLSSGIYFVRVQSIEGIYTAKFVKE
ncbi:hypothetical protein BH11BAC1_BH11BAC1_06820 [soil metagenome]